jgi:prepilin-type N-terminal cleavage/methylation domain-containing protein
MVSSDKGYSLVELIVVMAIFIIVMLMGSYAFERLLASSAQLSKSAESNIEGIIGLEVMRRDIEHAGYGLPWAFQNVSSVARYKECDVVSGWQANGVDSTLFNDVPPDLPRATLSGTSTKEVTGAAGVNSGNGPDYLVVKSSLAAINNAAKKWSFVTYSASSKSFIKVWGSSDDIQNDDRVITISSTFSQSGKQNKLLVMDDTNFFYKVAGTNPPPAFQPGDASQLYITYGVSSNNDLKMPYNRVDFYVGKKTSTKIPASCNPNTGILYKAVANHTGGGFTEYPLLDCVGDMQVEFELDPNNNGNIAYTENILGLSAEQVRDQLKNVRVYILTHEGRKDTSFKYPATDASNVLQVGDKRRPTTSGRVWSSANMLSVFGADWMNYRWKIYTIVVRPKNLN